MTGQLILFIIDVDRNWRQSKGTEAEQFDCLDNRAVINVVSNRLSSRERRSSLATVEVEPTVLKRRASATGSVIFQQHSTSITPSSSLSSLSAFGHISKSAFQQRGNMVLVAPLAFDDEEEESNMGQWQHKSNIVIAITSADEDDLDQLLTDEEDYSLAQAENRSPVRYATKRPTDKGNY